MFNRFTKDARQIVDEATEIARELGAPSVEAEHLLLAARAATTPAAGVLRAAGLDHDGLRGGARGRDRAQPGRGRRDAPARRASARSWRRRGSRPRRSSRSSAR